jgi:hypothetical protein
VSHARTIKRPGLLPARAQAMRLWLTPEVVIDFNQLVESGGLDHLAEYKTETILRILLLNGIRERKAYEHRIKQQQQIGG